VCVCVCVCVLCFPGSGGDQDGAFEDRSGEGAGGVEGEPASVQESGPHDRSHRQDHRGAGEGQGHPGRPGGQRVHPTCRVRAERAIPSSVNEVARVVKGHPLCDKC